MNILGISCFYHDAAAALLQDGKIVAAAEEERFSRRKHDSGFPQHAVNFCLRKGGLELGDLDYVIFYDKPFLKFERVLMSALQGFPKAWGVFREGMTAWLLDKLWVKGIIRDKMQIKPENILFTTHHMSHAASSFFCSPFEEAAILTADGVGEWATASLGVGKDTLITLNKELHFPHSIGLLYSTFTAFLGFEVNEGEYKVMGMASYGEPKYVDRVMELIDLSSDGSFRLNMDYFSYHQSVSRTFNSKFEKIFGKSRHPSERDILDPYFADVAASMQMVTEDILLKMANHLYQETGLKKLCMAGGVALNSVANTRILRETPFEELFIQPSAGDGGGAVGAALYAYHTVLGHPRSYLMEHAYLGEEFGPEDIKVTLDRESVHYELVKDEDALVDKVAQLLSQGKVVGWMQGRFEFGPRALGNRSILADPRRAEMKDLVNSKIKFREPFRPFAPSIISEETKRFFALPKAQEQYPARYMLLVVDVKEDMKSVVPAITHVDGTARLQTVHQDASPLYHSLISKFGEATGVPVVLNTSFNLRGEPIVNSPEDALNTFMRSGMDALVMDRFLVTKA